MMDKPCDYGTHCLLIYNRIYVRVDHLFPHTNHDYNKVWDTINSHIGFLWWGINIGLIDELGLHLRENKRIVRTQQ